VLRHAVPHGDLYAAGSQRPPRDAEEDAHGLGDADAQEPVPDAYADALV
jgi:hypothetical protein